VNFLNYFLEYNRYLNIVGILVILGIAALFSRKKLNINFRLVGLGLLLQFIIGFVVLRTVVGRSFIDAVAVFVQKLYQFADTGSGFIFGKLVDASMPWGFIFAFKVLPVIIFFGAFMSLLFHMGVVQHIVSGVSRLISPLLGTSGAETLCAIANSFLGQTEAPLLIRHYLKGLTKSEMLVVMVSGMGSISGAILVVFASMGVPAEHLLAASVMSIPSSLVIAKILYPQTEATETGIGATVEFKAPSTNVFDAIATGTIDGLHLALNVAAMLISFLALIAMLNYGLEYISEGINSLLSYYGSVWQIPVLNMGCIFSYVFAPFGYLLGFTGNDIFAAGQLIGTKVAVNELIAYSKMVTMHLSERTVTIMTYALCGFSNFSCIGIQVGGIGALVPERRAWLTEMGLLAVLGGALSNLLSAMVASLLL
jgi:CNT family concentrative nucleoside transporter